MNHSIDWLDKQEDSSCVLKFAINRGRKSIIKRKAHDEEVIGEKIKRMKLKFQKKDSNLRRNIQRKAKQMMKNKSLTMQCVSQLHDNMENMTKETCYEFITNIMNSQEGSCIICGLMKKVAERRSTKEE